MPAVGPYLALALGFAVFTTVGPMADTRVSDLYLYGQYAELLSEGLWPFRDFPFEYPPLGMVPIAIAGLFGPGEGGAGGAFDWAFGTLMVMCAVAGQATAAAAASATTGRAADGRTVAWLLATQPLVIGASLRTHFDLLPIAVTLLAVLWLVRGRLSWGFAALAVGTVIKLFPALLVVVSAAWLLGRRQAHAARRGLLIAGAVVGVVVLPFASGGVVDMVAFHMKRPIQIESTPASVLFALGGSQVTGTTDRPDRFKSNGLDGGAAAAIAAVFVVLQLAALLAVVALATRRRDARHFGLCCLAAVLAFVALGKVFSPQYVIWLAPFAALAWVWGARAVAVLCAAAIALTSVWFPRAYVPLVQETDWVIATVAVRNGLLVVALGLLIAQLSGVRALRSVPLVEVVS